MTTQPNDPAPHDATPGGRAPRHDAGAPRHEAGAHGSGDHTSPEPAAEPAPAPKAPPAQHATPHTDHPPSGHTGEALDGHPIETPSNRTGEAPSGGTYEAARSRTDQAPSDDRGEAATDGRTSEALVLVRGLRKVYNSGPKEVVALDEVSFEAYPGELIAIRGRSGSGKTTLLNQIGGLDRPDGGRVVVAGRTVTELAESGLLELRRDVIGFVFQSFGLIPVLSAAENVGVPMRLSRVPAAERDDRVRMLLSLVGLEKHRNQRPYELSGGQQQRVAIARALANRPKLLIADEPTGQLDSQTGRQIMQLLRALVRSEGVTALVATHDPALITLADRVLHLHDGAFTAPIPTPA
ncbi:ABC transporter ATP-binding protein [Sphaerisporangium sp. NPDC005289]|uniref:ABC transporter ATP-binding protein n=1 Tax=Sphaerisporangium sp. NPDC005289 TaxID=3155247 RepID=UPI0033B368B5